ncbi:MAG: Crp/Fnr family transcriptional regulator [Tenericutes bacterium]|nr:Crp/Fnr family transcriptional regulator [Mycoplasmatota bacterium]
MKRSSYDDNVKRVYEHYLTKTKNDAFNISSYQAGKNIVMQGDEIDHFFFVVSGKLKIFRTFENGKTLLIRIFEEFTILGDLEYFLKIEANCSVETQSVVKLIKIPFDYIDKEYRNDNKFLYNILVQTSSKILLTQEQTSINLMHSLDTRFSSYILSLAEGNSKTVIIPSLIDISNHLGTSYRHLTRTIKKLINQGAIMKTKNEVTLLNKELLLKISQGNVYESQIDYKVEG